MHGLSGQIARCVLTAEVIPVSAPLGRRHAHAVRGVPGGGKGGHRDVLGAGRRRVATGRGLGCRHNQRRGGRVFRQSSGRA